MNDRRKTLVSSAYISFHFLFSRKNRRYTASWFTIIGIAIGFMAIFIVIGIMNGLQSGYLEDIREIKSYHLQVSVSDMDSLEAVQEEISALDEVISAVRYLDTHALIEYRSGQYYPVLLRGLESTALMKDTGLKEHLNILDEYSLFYDREIILSDYLSKVFRNPVGTELSMTLMGTGRVVKHVPLTFSNTVASRFSSGFPEVNTQMVFISEETLKKVLPEQVPLIGIKCSLDGLDDLKLQIEGIEGVKEVVTWKEANYGFYSALMLEKYGMMVLLSLIFLVVILNAKSSFEKYVFHKKDDIALMRSIGASKQLIYLVFLIQGIIISSTGILLGGIMGTLAANHIGELITLIERVMGIFTSQEVSFFIRDLPVALYPNELITLAVIVLIIFLFTIFIAIRGLIQKTPLEIMRYE